jgi:type IV pilus assembly protein PilX
MTQSNFDKTPAQPTRRGGFPSSVRLRSRQRGVVLMIALIVLVAMTLAGIAMIRSVDSGTMVASNLSFQQGTLQSGDSGAEAARDWLLAKAATNELNEDTDDNKAAGYRATWQTDLDLTGNQTASATDDVNWEAPPCQASDIACAVPANGGNEDSAHNRVSYIIHRMCSSPKPISDETNSCSTASVAGTGSTKDSDTHIDGHLGNGTRVYYRVTSRIVGPKNTVSFVQTMIVL